MSVFKRLYRGETNIDFIGSRRRWYMISGVLALLCVLTFVVNWFHFGVEFAGGSQFVVPAASTDFTLAEVRDAVEESGAEVSSAQQVGQGGERKFLIRTPVLDNEDQAAAKEAITEVTGLPTDQITATEVSSSWGREVTRQALYGLVAFLVLVSAYIWIRFERAMAIAALGALFHDLLLTAGAYSVIGFEVSPATVIGLLTILGFSLYDTVVVFDKVDENTRGLLGSSRYTYGEAANLAVNQTLMRSINTTLIALLPVSGLLIVGAGVLGYGTLKDLALVLFVGMLSGAYSSLFLATPWLVDIKMLDQRYKLHAQRVLARRADPSKGDRREARKAAAEVTTGKSAAGKGAGRTSLSKDSDAEDEDTESEVVEAAPARAKSGGALAGSAPRTGARPSGSRNSPRKRQGGRKR